MAYFLIDAFRYEMATELLREFAGAGTTVHLAGRYAELPTITAVGMNALAPVAKAGRLTLAGRHGVSWLQNRRVHGAQARRARARYGRQECQ